MATPRSRGARPAAVWVTLTAAAAIAITPALLARARVPPGSSSIGSPAMLIAVTGLARQCKRSTTPQAARHRDLPQGGTPSPRSPIRPAVGHLLLVTLAAAAQAGIGIPP